MPRHRGLFNQAWANCDRCGFVHPISMLTPQNGLLLCHDHGCYDNIDIWQREAIISRILQQPDNLGQKERAEINTQEELYF